MTIAEENRDAALARVASNAQPWTADFIARVADLADDFPGVTVTGDTLRRLLIGNGLAPPHHANAWGAAMALAKRRGLVAETGRWIPMTDPKSNARRTPEYRLVARDGEKIV